MFKEIYKLSSYFWKLAVPFEALEFESLHDKELREVIKKDIIVYHGTSSKKLAKIINHGSLDPTMSQNFKTYENASPGIFVSKREGGLIGAEMYANISSQGDKSDPVLLEIVVPFHWISEDPDDSRHDESGNLNHLGKAQGLINQPISIKRIKRVWAQGEEINEIAPSKDKGDFFDRSKTAFIPLGVFLEKIKKAVRAGQNLPDEYYEMVNMNIKGLSKSNPTIEREQVIAKGLENFFHNYYEVKDVYKEALLTVLNSKTTDANSIIQEFLGKLGEDFEDVYYKPNRFENIFIYLKRTGML
jgi:hypothetical protein